jgi:hypothetical protein
MREMLHKAIDLEPVVLDFVQDVVHDVIDSTREVISVRVDSDGSGALEVQAAQANAELDVVEATFDQEIEARRDEVGKAHRAVDDAIDYLEANPQALPYIKETRAMADDLNAVTPDASVIEHEA